MELSTLKKWRVVVPSVLLALVLAPLIYNSVKAPESLQGLLGDLVKFAALLIFLPLGYLYDSLQIRRFLNGASHERINRYVEDQLRLTLQAIVPSEDLSKAAIGDKRWMRLLYRQVDKDPTLAEIAKRIRDNGLRWTTVADIALVFIPGGVLLGLFASFQEEIPIVWWAFGLISVGFFACLLIPMIERRHVDLCSDQQDHIRGFLSEKLRDDFLRIFSP